jgi:proteasome alpha subunit
LSGTGAERRELTAAQLEVAVLDRRRSGRTFRRITGTALDELVAQGAPARTEPSGDAEAPADAPAGESAGSPSAGKATKKATEQSDGDDT